MELVPDPYFISPHAVNRYITRIKPCREIEAIQQIQRDLQNANIVERFLDKRVYDCISYYVLVGPPHRPRIQEWPSVITIIDPAKYHPNTNPFYNKYNPWRSSKIDLWLPAEQHYLRCHWCYVPSKTLARHLGRSVKAIQQQAYKLGFSRKLYRKWQECEIKVMEWLYSRSTIDFVVSLLGRSRNSIRAKAHRLALANRDIPFINQANHRERSKLYNTIINGISNKEINPSPAFLQKTSSHSSSVLLEDIIVPNKNSKDSMA